MKYASFVRLGSITAAFGLVAVSFMNCSGFSLSGSGSSKNGTGLAVQVALPAGLNPDSNVYSSITLAPNQTITVADIALVFQTDGNLVLYRNFAQGNQEVLWNTGTGNRQCGADCQAIFQTDGNLVLYQGGSAYWNSQTSLSGGLLVLKNRAPYIAITNANGLIKWSGSTSLTWFSPLDNIVNYGSYRPGEQDFMSLFDPSFNWSEHLKNVRVFKAYAQLMGQATDAQLTTIFTALRANHVALAMESCMLNVGANGCGSGIEGYCDFSNPAGVAARIKALGGDLAYVSMDEVFGANLAPTSCHQSAQDLATNAATVLQNYQAQFPMVQVGDIENIGTGAAWLGQYTEWLDQINAQALKPIAFFHGDIDWNSGAPLAGVAPLQQVLASRGVPFGLIFNGAAGLSSNEAWVSSGMNNIQNYLGQGLPPPQHPVFQSWDTWPQIALPETSPAAHAYLVNYYAGLNLAQSVPVSTLGQGNAPGGGSTMSPAPTPPSTTTTTSSGGGTANAMLRYYNSTSKMHFYTASAAEGAASGGVSEGTAFAFMGGTGTAGTFAFYRCMGPDYFLSTSATCEGKTRVDSFAYGSFYITQGGAGRSPIYRYVNPANGFHIVTANSAEGQSAGYTLEGIIGFGL